MSIGSISSGKTVSGVKFAGNTVTDSLYGIRIKVKKDATSGSVSDVTYSQSVPSPEQRINTHTLTQEHDKRHLGLRRVDHTVVPG